MLLLFSLHNNIWFKVNFIYYCVIDEEKKTLLLYFANNRTHEHIEYIYNIEYMQSGV